VKDALTYDDVLLVPQYSDIKSRKEVSLSVDLGRGLGLESPIISSPMDTVTESEMAAVMSIVGGAGIIHRYNTIDEQADLVIRGKSLANGPVGAAIGVTGDYLDRASALVFAGASILCVDVAHGHHILVKEALTELRKLFGDRIHIMAGNVATLEGFNDLADWGADSIRCNIGGGSICTTRIQTGHGIPGLQTIMDCARSDRGALIIADGGLKTSGDITKAIAAGADLVMLGSLLSGTDESPGEVISSVDNPSIKYKRYRGMASKAAQEDWKGTFSSLEGVSSTVPYKGAVVNVLDDLLRGLRSGLSYSGCRSISEFHSKARFVRQTAAGQVESSAHINR